ncbi:MAG TPA: DoxX family protein [Ktedonobacterales bacterium]
MVPFVVLIAAWLGLRGLGALGVAPLASWQTDAAYALALMFLVTASAHFGKSRADMIAMVPERLPLREQAVTLTGALEILGAAGLLLSATRTAAGAGLILMMLAMLPANISAARRNVPLRGRRPTPLWLRIPLQAVFIGVTIFAAAL